LESDKKCTVSFLLSLRRNASDFFVEAWSKRVLLSELDPTADRKEIEHTMMAGEKLLCIMIEHQAILYLLVDFRDWHSTAPHVMKSWDDLVEASAFGTTFRHEFLIAGGVFVLELLKSARRSETNRFHFFADESHDNRIAGRVGGLTHAKRHRQGPIVGKESFR